MSMNRARQILVYRLSNRPSNSITFSHKSFAFSSKLVASNRRNNRMRIYCIATPVNSNSEEVLGFQLRLQNRFAGGKLK